MYQPKGKIKPPILEVGSEKYEVGKSVTIGERNETGRTNCTIDTAMIREEMAYQPECENKPPQQKTAAADS